MTAGTCDWLLRHDTYQRWAVCDRGLLWVKGKPGSGKSSLLKHALEHRTAKAGNDEIVLSFFFHGRGEELQKTPLGFFRSILHQLLGRVPDSLPDLVEAYKKKQREIGESGKEWQWHKEELRRFVESSLPRVLWTRSVWLFIDALDECGEENAVDLFRWLKALLRTIPAGSSPLRILATCRHYPILDVGCEFEVCPEKENKQDIAAYVDAQFSELHVLAASYIPRFIIDGASGVFMWARLVVERVLRLERRGRGLNAIWMEIQRVPKELHDLYQELVCDMQSQGSASLRLIQWVCFAVRPLSLDELRWAMVIGPDSPCKSLKDLQSSENWVPDNEQMWRQVRTLSCGLAEVTSSSGTQAVQFIHQSVKDFFLAKGLSMLDEDLKSAAAIGMVHFRLSMDCLRYLDMEEIGGIISLENGNTGLWGSDLDMDLPFLRYATMLWGPHMEECAAQGVAQDAIRELISRLSDELVDLWVRVHHIMKEPFYIKSTSERPSKGSSLLHALSLNGILGPLAVVLQREDLTTKELNAKNDNNQTPLMLAAQYGHDAVVRLLLETGKTDVNPRDRDGYTPLLVAAMFGHEAVVRLLLQTGKADVNSRFKHGWTALSLAAMFRQVAVVKLLLQTGKADINLRCTEGLTPLQYAIKGGNEAIIKLLLDTGKCEPDELFAGDRTLGGDSS